MISRICAGTIRHSDIKYSEYFLEVSGYVKFHMHLMKTKKQIMNICSSACDFHHTMIKNMVERLTLKNIKLVEKLEVTTKHSLREKILTYLSQLAQESNSATVISLRGACEKFSVNRETKGLL